MGKIVRRGIDFSGGGGSISNPTAASVTFNNTNTGLEATNVQDAVTEVNGKLIMSKKVNVYVENGWGSITRSMVGLNSVTQIMCVKSNGIYWALGRYDNTSNYRVLMVGTNNNTLVSNITGTFEVEVYYHN